MRGNGTSRPGTEQPQTAGPAARASGAKVSRSGVKFSITQRQIEGATTLVTVDGELDLASAPNLKWTLTDVVGSGARQIVVDLSPVTFIDSTALGVLVAVHRGLGPERRMAIAGTEGDVRNIFELTGLDSTFDMFATLDEALAWIRGSEAAAG
jgi:anti-sigma B factor antagonist